MSAHSHKDRTPKPGDESRHKIGAGGKVDGQAIRKAVFGESAASSPSTPADARLAAIDDPDLSDADAAAQSSLDDDAPNRVVFSLRRDLNKRLDKYLTDRITFMSRTQLQRLIDEGGVFVNQRPPKASTKLRINDIVEVFVPPPPSSEIQPEEIPLDVLYEDEHLIVLNKRPDIIVHPARSHNSGTMLNALAYHFRHTSKSGGSLSEVGAELARPGVVHRLDRHTSGLIVFAKSEEAHWRIARQFELRQVDKRYLAICHGEYPVPVDPIDFPLGPHPSKEKGHREKFVVRHDHLGKPSLTICRVRQVFHIPNMPFDVRGSAMPGSTEQAGGRFSLVELELKTGRTHQIRVHLSHMGFPIVGDDLYGGKPVGLYELGLQKPRKQSPQAQPVGRTPDPSESAAAKNHPLIARQALHAATLSFRHPVTEQTMAFTAPMQRDMSALIEALRQADPSAEERLPPGATVKIETL